MKWLARSCYAAARKGQDGLDPTPTVPPWVATQGGTPLTRWVKDSRFGYYKDGLRFGEAKPIDVTAKAICRGYEVREMSAGPIRFRLEDERPHAAAWLQPILPGLTLEPDDVKWNRAAMPLNV